MSNNLFKWILRQAFWVLFGSYLVFALIEELRRGFVTRYLSLSWALVAVAVIGFISFQFPPKGIHEELPNSTKKQPALLIATASLLTVAFVWFGALGFGLLWRIIISLFGGFATLAMLLILFED